MMGLLQGEVNVKIISCFCYKGNHLLIPGTLFFHGFVLWWCVEAADSGRLLSVIPSVLILSQYDYLILQQ